MCNHRPFWRITDNSEVDKCTNKHNKRSKKRMNDCRPLRAFSARILKLGGKVGRCLWDGSGDIYHLVGFITRLLTLIFMLKPAIGRVWQAKMPISLNWEAFDFWFSLACKPYVVLRWAKLCNRTWTLYTTPCKFIMYRFSVTYTCCCPY